MHDQHRRPLLQLPASALHRFAFRGQAVFEFRNLCLELLAHLADLPVFADEAEPLDLHTAQLLAYLLLLQLALSVDDIHLRLAVAQQLVRSARRPRVPFAQ